MNLPGLNPQDSLPKNRAITSLSAQETLAIGEKIAGLLDRGGVLSLCGPLGAGKTVLVKGIAGSLGIKEEITSPTYTIVSEYEGIKDGKKLPFYHIDAYRLKGEDDFTAMGGEEYIYGNGITVVEWSERIAGILPEYTLSVNFEISGPNSRIITITGGKDEHSGN